MSDFINKWKKYLMFAAVLSSFVNSLQLTFSFYMFSIYRNVIISYSGYSLANITAAAFFSLTIFGLVHYLRSRLLAMAGKDLNQRFRDQAYQKIIELYAFAPQKAYSQGLNDLLIMKQYFSNPAIYSLMDAPWAPFYLALIYTFHPVLGTVATAGTLVMLGLSVLQEALIRKKMTDANQINSENQRFVTAFLKNAEVINGMGMTKAIGDRFDLNNRAVIENQATSSMIAGAVQSAIKPLQNVIQVFIYCFGAYYAMTEGFDVGLMVAASIIMGRGLQPLMQVSSSWKTTIQARDAYQRFSGFVRFMEQQAPRMKLSKPKGHVQLMNASVRLGNAMLLHNVSFQLAPGEFLGVIGPSGAGKTTLCRLLLGIWPAQAGLAMLDGCNTFLRDKEEAGQYIGYLPQEIELFDASLARNIARMGEPDLDKVMSVAKKCGIHDLIESLPQGYDSQLGGNFGIQLSGGQKQRIGLARAMYDDPSLLILDEPTSNMDEAGEKDFMEAMTLIKAEGLCTCVMVTHKPALLQAADKVLVMQAGQVALFGPRDEVFQRLFSQQQKGATA